MVEPTSSIENLKMHHSKVQGREKNGEDDEQVDEGSFWKALPGEEANEESDGRRDPRQDNNLQGRYHDGTNNSSHNLPRRMFDIVRRFVRRNKGLTTWMICLVAVAMWGRRQRLRKRVTDSSTSSTSLSLLIGRMLQAFFTESNKDQKKVDDYRKAPESPLSHLWEAIQNGLVEKVLLSTGGSSMLYYKYRSNDDANTITWLRTRLPPDQPQMVREMIQALHSIGGCSDVQVLPGSWSSRLAQPMLAALPFVYLFFLYRMVRHFSNQHSNISSMENDDDNNNKQSLSSTTFADVAGLDAVIPDVQEIVQYLRDPTTFQTLGARPPRGILLHGPPGCGKTLLAKAVAGEADVDAFCACNASDFVEVFVGRGAARVRHLFAQLRRRARRHRNQTKGAGWSFPHWLVRYYDKARDGWWRQSSSSSCPLLGTNRGTRSSRPATALLFVDELDALAKTRSVLSSSDEREQTLMQLLTEMDGFGTNNNSSHNKNSNQHHNGDMDDVTLVVLAASNRPDILDPAILRRFDRQILVNYPDTAGRVAILRRHARHVHVDPNAEIDWQPLAAATTGWSGSDLRNVVNEAALLAVRSRSTAVSQAHFEQAIQKFRVSRASAQRSTLPSFRLLEEVE